MRLPEEYAKSADGRTGLLLHACCAPCLTIANQRLSLSYGLSIFWFNPNIEPYDEHEKRLETLREYLTHFNLPLMSDYDWKVENKKWHDFIEGLENEPEGGKRCEKCFQFRLEQTAKIAKAQDSLFSTTLTVSPYKSTQQVNAVGNKAALNIEANFLALDLKKMDGYKKSLELSKEYKLYRQNYCGCKYSNTKH